MILAPRAGLPKLWTGTLLSRPVSSDTHVPQLPGRPPVYAFATWSLAEIVVQSAAVQAADGYVNWLRDRKVTC